MMEKKETNHYIGIDIGGTAIKMALIQEDGKIQEKWSIPTDLEKEGSFIVTDIALSINDKLYDLSIPKENILAAGVGIPGFVDAQRGLVHQAVNIGWNDYPIAQELKKALRLPVFIENDANLAALGESWKGAGRGSQDTICVTIGTGIGGGIISNGKIVRGTNGAGGEIGHIVSVPSGGILCNCGKTGCLETIASATGITRLANARVNEYTNGVLFKMYIESQEITAKDVFKAFENGDPLSIQIIEEACNHLGLALANISNTLNPQKIIIGGGVSKAGQHLLKPLKKSFIKYALPRVAQGVDFSVAELGNDAGTIGAAYLAHKNLNKY